MAIESRPTAKPAARTQARIRARRGAGAAAGGFRFRFAIRSCIPVFLATLLGLGLACARPPAPAPEVGIPSPPPSPPAAAVPPSPPLPDPLALPCPAIERLEVRKHERRLEAHCAGGGLRVFAIALSREPVGAKRRSGDQRIPEGDYRIAGTARPSRFELFIPIDYPARADADRGLAEGLISRDVHRRIVSAHERGQLPPQDTALGGLVGFHGEGPRWRGDLDLDWTQGCVAVADETIRWLAQHAKRGTPVAIVP